MAPKFKHLTSKPKPKSETARLAAGELPVGNAEPRGRKLIGEVLKYNQKKDSYTVITRGDPGKGGKPGMQQLLGVPRKVESPGIIAPLPSGTTVVVDFGLGFPYIDGVLNVNSSQTIVEKGSSKPIRFGGTSSVTSDKQLNDDASPGYFRFPGAPEDALPGDHALVSPDGNYVAALRGKESSLFGSTKAQIRALGDKDLVQIVCEDYENFNGFGDLRIYNAQGRAGLRFDAGADQKTQSGGAEKQWTFTLAIGDEGDFFLMEVKGDDGSTKAKFHITSDGQVTLMGANGVHILNGGKAPSFEEVGSDSVKRYKGNYSAEHDAPVSRTMKSTYALKVSESKSQIIGHNDSKMVNNHQTVSIGGNQYVTITGGNPLTAEPTNIAVDMKVLNGSYLLEIGDPLAGANTASALAGYSVFVHNGEIILGENPSPMATPSTLAMVSLNTKLPNSVALGGLANPMSTNPAMLHACLFEPLSIMLTGLLAMLDGHTHTTAWGPSGPPIVPFSPSFSSGLPNIQSVRVLIGA